MPDKVPECLPEHMPEDLLDRMPDDMPEHMPEDTPEHMPEDMPNRMPEDLRVTKCVNVMVGITRSKVFFSIILSVTIYRTILFMFSLYFLVADNVFDPFILSST